MDFLRHPVVLPMGQQLLLLAAMFALGMVFIPAYWFIAGLARFIRDDPRRLGLSLVALFILVCVLVTVGLIAWACWTVVGGILV